MSKLRYSGGGYSLSVARSAPSAGARSRLLHVPFPMDYLSRRPHRAYASLEHFPSHEKASSERASSVFSRAIHWFTCGTARNTSGALAFAPGSFSALHPMSTDETRERASLRDFPPSKKRVSMKGLHERSRACAAASTTFSSSASSLHVSPRSLLPPSLAVPASLNFFT